MGLAIVTLACTAALLLAGFALPRHVVVGRRVIIDAPPELVLPDVAELAAWEEWGTPVVSENDAHKGVRYKVETGRHVIDGRVLLNRDGTRTAVAWVDRMDLGRGYFDRYYGATLDLQLGPRIEQSLLELKRRAEERAKAKGIEARSAPLHDEHEDSLAPRKGEGSAEPPKPEEPSKAQEPPKQEPPPPEPTPEPVPEPRAEPQPEPVPEPPPEAPAEPPADAPAEPPPGP